MNRFALVIAVLFAVASLTLATVSAVFAADDGPGATTVTAVAFCLSGQDAPAKAPSFKPCGKRVNGFAVLCHADPVLLPQAAPAFAPPRLTRLARLAAPLADSGAPQRLFRPPRRAPLAPLA